jgi:hypothetical protein
VTLIGILIKHRNGSSEWWPYWPSPQKLSNGYGLPREGGLILSALFPVPAVMEESTSALGQRELMGR